MLIVDADGIEDLGVPIKYRHEPAEPSFAIPALGEHNREVFGDGR